MSVGLVLFGVMHPDALTGSTLQIEFDTLATDAEVTALVQQWQTPPADLNGLIMASKRTHDGRLFSAVLTAALNPGQSSDVRLAAMAVLITHFDSLFATTTAKLLEAPIGESLVGITDLAPFRTGSVAFPPDRRDQVAVALRDLAVNEGSTNVGAAARYLRQALAYERPDVTPVDFALLGFQYMCGNRFQVSNASDVTLPVTIEFTQTSRRDSLLLDSIPDVLNRVPEHSGSARLLIGEQEAATVQLGQFPCFDGLTATPTFFFGGGTPGPPSFSTSSVEQVLEGTITTSHHCYDIDGQFAVNGGTWTVTVTATANIPPGQVCTTQVTRFEYLAQFIGMPPGQNAVTVIHEVNGAVVDTFSVTADVPQ